MHLLTLTDVTFCGVPTVTGPGVAERSTPLHVIGGAASIAYEAGYLWQLLRSGILVSAVPPAGVRYRDGVTDVMPVTGGSLDPVGSTGTIVLTGGTQYVNSRSERWVTLTDFTVSPYAAVFSARLDTTATRGADVAPQRASAIPAAPSQIHTGATVRGGATIHAEAIKLRLTVGGADLLNDALDVTVFTDRMEVGVLDLGLMLRPARSRSRRLSG